MISAHRGLRTIDAAADVQPERHNDALLTVLLDRIARGEEHALTELHRLFGRRIYAFALQRLGDAYEAETVVVDVLYEVWKGAARFRGESKVATWILGIAHFKVLSTLRARGQGHEDLDDYAEEIESQHPTPAMHLEQQQQQDAVRGCLAKLKAPHRECLQLVFYEGMSLTEVAQVQNVPENTVKTRLFYARKSLKSCLARI